MDLLGIATTTLGCLNEGLDFFFKVNECYEIWNSRKVEKSEKSVSISGDAVNLKEKKCEKRTCERILLYISDIIDNEKCQNTTLQKYNITKNFFHDDKNLNQRSSVISKHSKDSIIVIRTKYEKKVLNLQLELLNIVPGNDDICYVLSCSAECSSKCKDKILNEFINEAIKQIIQIYEKYQQTVDKNRERLELEARILVKMGYKDIIYKQVKMGYGLEIQLGDKKLMIGIPQEYPKIAPTVILLYENSYRKVDFGSEWEPFFTIAHIVKAIEKGEKK